MSKILLYIEIAVKFKKLVRSSSILFIVYNNWNMCVQ